MNRIVRPKGPTLYRITLEVDVHSQLEMRTEDLSIPGVVAELPIGVSAQILMQAATPAVMAFFAQFGQVKYAAKEKENHNSSI